MKLRQKFAAVMAAAILATSMPTFAASTNGVSKIITVAKDTTLEGAIAPELKIELKDNLAKDQMFYLDLSNAEWATDAAIKLNAIDTLKTDLEFTRESKTQLGVKVIKADGIAASSAAYRIPMFAKVTGGEATVEIDSNDTVVTGGKYIFAISNDATGKVTVADPSSFATVGKVAEITIEEPYIGAFQSADKAKKVRFELDGSGFEYNLKDAVDLKDADGKVIGKQLENVFVGKKSYADKKYSAVVIDETTLEVTIPEGQLSGSQRGAFTLTGVEIRADKDASYGEVNITVSGDLNETTEVLVAKYGDYGTQLKVAKEYTVTAGQKLKDIEFTLSETIADSINGNRETRFAFPEGVTIDNVTVVESKLEGIKKDGDNKVIVPVATVEKKDGKNTNEFTVGSMATDSSKKTSVTFKATLNVPASFTEDINLVVEGRSIEEAKQVEVAKVEAPATVEVTPATVKVGLAKQAGGKIVIKETDKGKLSSGKIFLAIDDSDIKYTKVPEVKVTDGNLKIDSDVELVTGGIEITVKGKSTKASTIEISGGELKVDRTVPEGSYAVKVGGTAISVHSADKLWNTDKKEYNDIDTILEKDFIIVGTPNTEDLTNGIKNKVNFVIGQAKYTVNGVEKTMDTAAYLAKEGRTMLPVRYVADALGVNPNQILWDGASKTVTILADRVVQVKLGSKEMIINGAKVPMTAAAEMKNNRVFIPVAEIARALGANVAWDPATQTATFN